jgi:DNA-binding transcriptional LysR family regulator
VNWDDLRYVLALAEAGSLARAARKLKVDHTTVGRRIEALEVDVGVRLFTRTTNGYTLTREAEEFLPDIRQIEANVLALERSAVARHNAIKGKLRVTASEALGSRFVAPRMSTFTRRHPDICVEFVTAVHALDLARREADIAIRLFRSSHDYLVVKRVAEFGYALYASEEYLARRPAPKGPDDLAKHDIVNLDMPTIGGLDEATWFDELGKEARTALVTNSTGIALGAALSGTGVTLLPCYIGDLEPTLRRLPMPNEPTRAVWLTVHKDLRRSPVIRAMLDFLTAMFTADADFLRYGSRRS